MDDEALWAFEERFWTGGEDHYRSTLDPACIMAFPAPVGIMSGSAIVQSLVGAPRWSSVAFSDRKVARPNAQTIVLGYRAVGQREGSKPYEAYCTSSYRGSESGWKLFQHQQTPIRISA